MTDRILMTLFVLGMNTFVLGQNPIKKDSITNLEEVIVLESILTKKAEGITPSDLIGAKIFENYSPIDAVSAINQIPGVYVLSGALNTNRITIRGIGARTLFGTDKLRLYYNEIPITNGSGFSSIEAFDLESLHQIEVVKGPKATSFGSNLGGAMLLQSKEALGNSTNFNNNFTVGSYNLLKNSFSFSHTDKKLSLSLNYDHIATDGYRENNSFERDALLLNASYRFSQKSTLGLLVNYVDYTAQIPSSLGITAFTENPKQAAFTWKSAQGFEANKYNLVGVFHNYRFNEKIKNSTSIFYTYLDHYEPRPFGILDEFTNGFGFRTRFYGDITLFSKTSSYSFGSELYKDEYNWSEFENLYQENNGNGSLQGAIFAKNKEFRTQLNNFATLLIPFDAHFSAQFGVNMNNTSYNYRDLFNELNNKSARRDFKTIVLPSFTLNYSFLENQVVYTNISRGYSNPTLEETLTPSGVINPDIEQETGMNYEVGTTLHLANKKLMVNAAIYQMNVKNLLVAQRVGDDQFVGKNAGKTKHQGLEVAANYKLDISSNLSLSPFVNYTFNHHNFVDYIDGENDFSGNELTGVPKHRLSSGLQLSFLGDFYWNTVHQYVGAIPLTDANTLYSEAFSIFNTKMGYQKKLSSNFSIHAQVGVNNLFNLRYAQSVLINTQAFGGAEPRYYYPGNDRNYYTSLQLRYTL
ncbi:TonB-dependent receptor domain-containing protein [Cellulophaga sp. Hel_I_12]|uniref:TonB-dependent receptor family protein n=1 Tax=Cellulophaga sp. Hel_I_12 TaxID=1249972 RepID=UPI0006486570|nr:TonB-dependent receptor [Cellulophaga sp. Hel_I_12]